MNHQRMGSGLGIYNADTTATTNAVEFTPTSSIRKPQVYANMPNNKFVKVGHLVDR